MIDRVVFYDGECGLCQRSISFISKIDSKKELFFAPLNGETYKQLFKLESDLTTVVFFHQNKLFTKSDAIIEICKTLGSYKILAVAFKIIPKIFRDKLYDFIANHRKKVSCIILARDERFLK